MANLANDNVYEMRVYSTLGTQTAIAVRHYRIASVVGTPTDTHLADGLDAKFQSAWKAIMTDDASYRGVGVQRLFPSPKTVPVFNIDGQGAGGVVSDPLPKQISGLVALKTAFAGREFRGRVYIPFPAEAHNDGVEGRPAASYLTLLDTLGALFDDAVTISSGGDSCFAIPVIWHPSDFTHTDIITAVPRQFWATQRRRGDYGPLNPSPI